MRQKRAGTGLISHDLIYLGGRSGGQGQEGQGLYSLFSCCVFTERHCVTLMLFLGCCAGTQQDSGYVCTVWFHQPGCHGGAVGCHQFHGTGPANRARQHGHERHDCRFCGVLHHCLHRRLVSESKFMLSLFLDLLQNWSRSLN